MLDSLKVPMELGVNLLNQILTGPFSVVGKALHMISFATPCKCIKVLKDFKWSKGSLTRRKFLLVACGTLVEGGIR